VIKVLNNLGGEQSHDETLYALSVRLFRAACVKFGSSLKAKRRSAGAAVFVATFLASNLCIVAASTPALPQKPAWLTDLSLGLKESYDDNVFLSGVDSSDLPASYTVPPGSVAALKDHSSWVTTVSPKIGVNFAPLFGDQKQLPVLSLAYAPDFAIYHQERSEDYSAHRLATFIKGKWDSVSFTAENNFAYVDGNQFAPFYPGALTSAYATAAVRERREQIQDRSAVTLQFDQTNWFIRFTASLLYYDLQTEQVNIPGYQNYADRYDVNGGGDLGFKFSPRLAVTMGYRYGHQYQEQYAFSPYSSPSDYHRVLVGFEGRPWNWLEFKLQAGPDFRHYPGDTLTHVTPLDDKNPVKYYGEASLTATFTPRDTLTFRYKQWQWLSSTGRIPYYDSVFDLCYRRKLTRQLTMDLGGRILSSDYTEGNLPACQRNDWQYTVSAGLAYAINAHTSFNLAYALDLGRNALDSVINPETREYHRNVISLGVLLKF